ncbi:choice-of-anchor I family protein [Formosa sp. S-31]|uniref:choice-of-anchor I family protein n=1 Tax=Formosa sp. S-31 TaxID=2790949 RepID=UPI003EBFF503
MYGRKAASKTVFQGWLFNFKTMYKSILIALAALGIWSCESSDNDSEIQNSVGFTEIGEVRVGGAAAAEITVFDVTTNKLFVVNNNKGSKVSVVNFEAPETMEVEQHLDFSSYGGVNSVAVKNGLLAVAVQAQDKTDNGFVVLYDTANLNAPLAEIGVGALPDMVTFSPDGKYIVTADEGEPNDDYSIDPLGTVSIIDTAALTTTILDFSRFESQLQGLVANGFRVFGPGASLANDVEPEYISINQASTTAWVALQENNGMARIDLQTKTITDIFPFGVKDFSEAGNVMDASNEDGKVAFVNQPVKSFYQPDAITNFEVGGTTYILTANEGDIREYDGFNEELRVKDLVLDSAEFPDAAQLQQDSNLGRLVVTNTLGDTDGDGDIDELYGFGARSFSIWNGETGQLVVDYNMLEQDLYTAFPDRYDDNRSDDKGVEPEGITVGTIDGVVYAFVGLERADAVLVYNVTNPISPTFVKAIKTGNAPEGVLFIAAEDSPNKQDLLVVSSEDDGFVKVFGL